MAIKKLKVKVVARTGEFKTVEEMSLSDNKATRAKADWFIKHISSVLLTFKHFEADPLGIDEWGITYYQKFMDAETAKQVLLKLRSALSSKFRVEFTDNPPNNILPYATVSGNVAIEGQRCRFILQAWSSGKATFRTAF